MVQGGIKKAKVGAALAKHHRKPEKQKAGKGGVAKNSVLQKKLKGQSTQDIEKLMATRAAATGKLTILKKLAGPTSSLLKDKSKKGKEKGTK
ncbi:hypothetical protein BCR44DRAFT_1504884 [Catenaria anguillulae PL171]|uniref:Uncharacterized protein n=1 Tax=Catenaria anguillulae PL171 TaxID=765915 RepID=A0A1Y2H758_9FUNG|nr:hypothetical protein BCR44DRAFT_1504884 [Catenaria anguillulae PL171]